MSFVDVYEETFEKIISESKCIYKVPPYQRGYSWDTEHWGDLYNDLSELKNDEVHFLGTVVVISSKNETSTKINYFEIIDGQQRIATLFTILIALRDTLTDRNLAQDVENVNLYVKLTGRDPEPKLILAEEDNQQLKLLLEDKYTATDTNHSIIKCYEFFKNKFTSLKESEKQAILGKVLAGVNIVLINAQKLENAFKLFETLNDRGLELSAVDLLKNYILKKAATIKDNGQTFGKIRDCWTSMYSAVKDKEPVKFVRRYMLAKYPGSISEKKLYEEMKSRINKLTDSELLSFAEDMAKFAEIYEDITENSFGDSEIDTRLTDLNMIQVGPSYSLILRVLDSYNAGKITKKQVLEILYAIEVFNIIWGVCDQPTADLDSIYNPICINFDNPQKLPDIETSISNYFKDKTKHIDDAVFENYFTNRSFKGSERRTKYILWRLNNKAFAGAVTLNADNVNTEHVLPKNLTEKWEHYLSSATGASSTEIKKKHDTHLNKLGNMTLLEHRWNKAMKDAEFEAKVSGNSKHKGYKDSDLGMTREISTKYSKWTFLEIESRTLEMSKAARKVWTFH